MPGYSFFFSRRGRHTRWPRDWSSDVCSSDLSGGAERATTQIRVIDSTYTESWEPMEDTGTVYRIEVVSPLGADTIRNVIPPAPVVVGDTLVIGLLQL